MLTTMWILSMGVSFCEQAGRAMQRIKITSSWIPILRAEYNLLHSHIPIYFIRDSVLVNTEDNDVFG